jgi:Uma2 family endonuclease
MAEARPHPWTVDDFLAFEAEEPKRYEFVDGIVRMMTGGSAAHSAIKTNVTNALNAALRDGPCRAYVDDLKVVTAAAVMYPDVVVTRRPLAPDDDRVPDPTVVVEVLSPTTETHDRIRKWREYQTITDLRHFVLVAQSERRIEVYSRTGAGWEIRTIGPPQDVVVLAAIDASLSLEAILRGQRPLTPVRGLIARGALPTRRRLTNAGLPGPRRAQRRPSQERRLRPCASTTTPMPI